MTDNKDVILQSRIEQLESEKSDLLEALEKTYRALCCNCYTRCEGCKIRNINDNILKKHGVEI